jgi:Family of unknown function (DUF6535)
LATSLQQWARRYIGFTQPPRSNPEKRARTRAFFAHGVNKMHLPWAVESLPALLHLSLMLFFAGLVIYLFNINHSVFISVMSWIGLFLMLYGWITMMPIFRHDSPFYTPLSLTVWSLHAAMLYILFSILTVIASSRFVSFRRWLRFRAWGRYYSDRMSGGVWKAMEESASKQSSDFDLCILDWTLGALGEDDMLEKFFEAIPGFSDSKLVKDLQRSLSNMFHWKFVDTLCGFLGRNLLSNSVSEEVKIRRLIIGMNAANAICNSVEIRQILGYLSKLRFDHAPQTIQTVQILARWCTSNEGDISRGVREAVVCILPNVRERDDRWIALAKDQFGLPEDVLRDNISRGDDSVLLAILIHMTRLFIHAKRWDLDILSSISKFDIRDTVPELQNEFCTLWNEIALNARMHGSLSHPLHVLRHIRHVYIALHEGTDAAPTQFFASTAENDYFLYKSSSYPLCNIVAHHPDSTAPRPTQLGDPNDTSAHPTGLESQPIPRGSTAPQQAEQASLVQIFPSSTDYSPSRLQGLPPPFPTAGPEHISPQVTLTLDVDPLVAMEVSDRSCRTPSSTADLTATIVRPDEPTQAVPINKTGESSQAPATTLLPFPHPDPVPDSMTLSTVPHLSSVSVQHPGCFLDVLQLNTLLTLSHPLDMNKQNIATPRATSDITQISSIASQITQSMPNIGFILRTNEESTGVPPTFVSCSSSSPAMTPALHGIIIPAELSSSIESAPVQPSHVSHPSEVPPSSLATSRSEVTPQVTFVLDASTTTNTDTLSAREHDEICELTPSIPMEVSLHISQLGPSMYDIVDDASPPWDRQNDRS